MKYRVWFTIQGIDPTTTPAAFVGNRTTFVIYEGPDGRHAKRLARNLARTRVTNRAPYAAIVESGWEVIDR